MNDFEKLMGAHVQLTTLVFTAMLTRDPEAKAEVVEVLRQFLVSPAVDASPELRLLVRSLRDALVAPIPQELVDTVRQPSIRPVE